MKIKHQKKTAILMSIGMLVIGTSQIITRLVELPDFARGAFLGVGIGLLMLAIVFGNLRTASK